jgi:hypothetical protein
MKVDHLLVEVLVDHLIVAAWTVEWIVARHQDEEGLLAVDGNVVWPFLKEILVPTLVVAMTTGECPVM